MAAQTITHGVGRLALDNSPPRLYISAETDDVSEFDQATLQKWRDEGFDVIYLPYNEARHKQYVETLHTLGDDMSLGESYAIVAFGDAAAACLEAHLKPKSKICALVAYYPSTITDPHRAFPSTLDVLVHLAGDEVGVRRNAEVLGIQGKRRTVRKRVNPGIGHGGLLTKLAYKSYTYEGVEPGFAEADLDEYDKVAERLAWSRSLGVVRAGFRSMGTMEVDLERVWEEHTELEFKTKDADKTMATMVSSPYVNHVPTLTGGVGKEALRRFYAEFFIPHNPPSLRMRLVSRTVGTDRVVDELYLAFDHTTPVPWMLPGVPPTERHVEVALVSVVCVRGGKLYHEHIYWDQASVLVQVGLLDPKGVPEGFKKQGVEKLPVVGKEAARKVLDEESVESNGLIPEW